MTIIQTYGCMSVEGAKKAPAPSQNVSQKQNVRYPQPPRGYPSSHGQSTHPIYSYRANVAFVSRPFASHRHQQSQTESYHQYQTPTVNYKLT